MVLRFLRIPRLGLGGVREIIIETMTASRRFELNLMIQNLIIQEHFWT